MSRRRKFFTPWDEQVNELDVLTRVMPAVVRVVGSRPSREEWRDIGAGLTEWFGADAAARILAGTFPEEHRGEAAQLCNSFRRTTGALITRGTVIGLARRGGFDALKEFPQFFKK